MENVRQNGRERERSIIPEGINGAWEIRVSCFVGVEGQNW
jgi:hypothetical protein